MASRAKAYQDVTLVLAGEIGYENEIDAEIVDEDNNNAECYVPNTDYYVRLYRTKEEVSVIALMNVGHISLENSYVQENISEEVIFFSGSNSAASKKFIQGNFQYTPIGQIYTIEGDVYSGGLSPTVGGNNVNAEEEIIGAFVHRDREVRIHKHPGRVLSHESPISGRRMAEDAPSF